eukprot:1142589-Amphidinium_carterae.1
MLPRCSRTHTTVGAKHNLNSHSNRPSGMSAEPVEIVRESDTICLKPRIYPCLSPIQDLGIEEGCGQVLGFQI